MAVMTPEQLAEWTPARRWEVRMRCPKSWPVIKQFLDNATLSRPIPDDATLAEQIKALCAEYETISVSVMCSPRRDRDTATVRMAAAYLMAEHCHHLTLPAIGKKLLRDHSTIIHAKQLVKDDLEKRNGERFGGVVAYVRKHLSLG